MKRIALRLLRSWTVVFGQLLLVFFLGSLMACGSSDPTGSDDDDPTGEETPPGEQLLTVLYTADEYANLLASPASRGAAELMSLWRVAENFDPAGDFLTVSGGNSWTGQVISTWFKGASVVEVMEVMGYRGQAIGSHEFQFGPEALGERATEADFPLLSSNIHRKAGGSVPGFATPYSVRDVNGLKVGMIGLTPVSTPQSNVPSHVEDFDFLPYAQALSDVVPQVRAAGADLVLVMARLCREEMMEILPVAQQLGVSMIGGGFCGETIAEVQNGVALVAPGWRFSSYGRVQIRVKEKSGEILEVKAEVRANTGGTPAEEVVAVVDKWEHLAEEELNAVEGYLNDALPNGSAPLHNFVMDSWLQAYPADIAMLNAGAIRTGLPAGDITKGAIVNMMPFENSLVLLELTGAQVVDCLQPSTILAGMSTREGYFHSDGTELQMDSTYHVLTTDFLQGSDSYKYKQYDPTPTATGILYSQPTLIYLEALATSPENPLDQFLDPDPRR